MSHIQIRIDAQEKEAVQEVLQDMGLNFSSAIKIFFRQVVKQKQIPFLVAAEDDFSEERRYDEAPSSQTPSWSAFTKQKIG